MCGILGTTSGSGQAALRAGAEALAHRGPDGEGFFADGPVALAHRRLSIIDLTSRADQPFVSTSGNTVASYNGEIYNYALLRAELLRSGVEFRTASDTEVLVEGYEKYGIDFFGRMRGMWAFALYDKRRHTVLLVRDHFGVKPLYYSIEGGRLSFASELHALQTLLPTMVPDSEAYALFYTLGYIPAPRTPFRGIRKLLPGEILEWNIVEKRATRVQLPHSTPVVTPLISSNDEAADYVEELLRASVRAHFVADTPVSLLLSGGTDSSLIAALAVSAGERPSAYHVSVPGSADTEYARQVAAALKLELIEEPLSPDTLHDAYERVFSILGEPTGDISIIPTALVFDRLKGRSKVVLTGDGGDELFGGYAREAFLTRHRRVRVSDPLSRAYAHAVHGGYLGVTLFDPLVRRAYEALLAHGDDLIGAYLSQVRLSPYPFHEEVVRAALVHIYTTMGGSALPPSLALDFLSYLPNDLLEKTDTASMAASVEARVPFVDHVLIAQVFSRVDPSLLTTRAGITKPLAKRILERYLPSELVYRPKSGFGFSFTGENGDRLIRDFDRACDYHLMRAHELGVSQGMSRLIGVRASREGIARKYRRFAFALISNMRYLERFGH